MSFKPQSLCWALAILLIEPGVAAANSLFMCVDRISGSSTDRQFAGCSEIFGVSYSVGVEGVQEPDSRGGARSGRPSCGSYVVTKTLDASSVPILIGTLVGRGVREVEFVMRPDGQEPTFRLILRNVVFVDVEHKLDPADAAPMEVISMIPATVSWQFIPVEENGASQGSIEGGFDCTRNARL